MTETHPEHEKLLEKLANQRETKLKQFGNLNPHVMAPLLNSRFTGGPRWPNNNQAWRYIELPDGNKLIISDGLANPFDDPAEKWKPTNGAGGELYIIINDNNLTFDNLTQSPWFKILVNASNIIADEAWHSGYHLPTLLQKYDYLSISIDSTLAPQGFQPENNHTFGIILGVKDPETTTTLTLTETFEEKTYELPTHFTQIIPLKPEELKYIIDKGTDGRKTVGTRLENLPREEATNINRKTVI